MAEPRYIGDFGSQFDGSPKAKENCVPASVANALRSATQGKVDKTGGEVRALVKQSEETNPYTPGWSLDDAHLAAKRLGEPLTIMAGSSWLGLKTKRNEGRMIVLQGDSEEFSSGCSAAFDGDHCIVIHPATNSKTGRWLKGDPICQAWIWEDEAVLRRYAENFGGGKSYFAYTDVVPVVGVEEVEVAVVISITPERGRYTIPANTVVTGLKIDPTTGEVATTKKWAANPNPSTASYDARIITTAFRGNPFIRAVDGFFAGYWISTGLVDEKPDQAPVIDCSAQVTAAKEAGISEGIAREKARVRTLFGL